MSCSGCSCIPITHLIFQQSVQVESVPQNWIEKTELYSLLGYEGTAAFDRKRWEEADPPGL